MIDVLSGPRTAAPGTSGTSPQSGSTSGSPIARRIALPTRPGRGTWPGSAEATSTPVEATGGRRNERRALLWIQVAGILGFVAGVLTTAALISPAVPGTSTASGSGLSSGNGSGGVQLTYGGSTLLWDAEAVGILLLVGEVVAFFYAFRQLSTVSPTFAVPGQLALLGVPGAAILLVGWAETPKVFQFGPTVLVLELAGGLLLLVGVVAIANGVWRLGRRYGRTLLSVAGPLLVLPVVFMVGDLLLILGARAERSRP